MSHQCIYTLRTGFKVKRVLFETAHRACMHLDPMFMLSFPETECLKKAWTHHLQENTCNMATLHHINGSKRHAALPTLSRSINSDIYHQWKQTLGDISEVELLNCLLCFSKLAVYSIPWLPFFGHCFNPKKLPKKIRWLLLLATASKSCHILVRIKGRHL